VPSIVDDSHRRTLARQVEQYVQAASTFPVRFERRRGREHGLSRFFTGLQVVEPGIVPVTQWRPDGGPTAEPQDSNLWAAIGRKP
jgi:hypothetical protein